MENSRLINSNKRDNTSGSVLLERGKCLFFACATMGILFCVIGSIVLNSVVLNIVNSKPNPIHGNTDNIPAISVEYTVGQQVKKGQPVGLCGAGLEQSKVCLIDGLNVVDSVLQTVGTLPGELISFVSDVNLQFTSLVQHVKIDANTQKLMFNAIVSNFPIVYYSVLSVDIFEKLGEKPLNQTETFKLMGTKMINYDIKEEIVTTSAIVTYVRTIPNEGSFRHQFKTVLVTITQNTATFSAATISVDTQPTTFTLDTPLNDEFNEKYFTIGMTLGNPPTITLYFNSISKGCQASVISFQNGKLVSLNALQQGPANVFCKKGLKGFTYDESTIDILL